jgi:glycosyltransferase involved in cell wall biosynthesis
VGRNPPDWLRRQVAGLPGAELHASVADVRPYLARSSVLAVPLRIGGGSRLKILEALASGLPVVSTRVGAEGLCLEPERHLTVVEGVEEMAGALVRCLSQPQEMQAQAERGRRVVIERYDWDRLADRLEQVWLATAVPRFGDAAAGCPGGASWATFCRPSGTEDSPVGTPRGWQTKAPGSQTHPGAEGGS